MAPVAAGGKLAGFRTISCSNGSTILPLLHTITLSPKQGFVSLDLPLSSLPYSALSVLSSVVPSLLSFPQAVRPVNW